MRKFGQGYIKIIRPTFGSNPCAAAQRGVLTLLRGQENFGLDKILAQKDFMGNTPLRKVTLEVTPGRNQARELLRALSFEGIRKASMFPTLEGAAGDAEERRLLPDNPQEPST